MCRCVFFCTMMIVHLFSTSVCQDVAEQSCLLFFDHFLFLDIFPFCFRLLFIFYLETKQKNGQNAIGVHHFLGNCDKSFLWRSRNVHEVPAIWSWWINRISFVGESFWSYWKLGAPFKTSFFSITLPDHLYTKCTRNDINLKWGFMVYC